MIPGAFAARERYAELKMPVVILAGEEDRLIDIDEQSARLHSELPNSTIHRVPACRAHGAPDGAGPRHGCH